MHNNLGSDAAKQRTIARVDGLHLDFTLYFHSQDQTMFHEIKGILITNKKYRSIEDELFYSEKEHVMPLTFSRLTLTD